MDPAADPRVPNGQYASFAVQPCLDLLYDFVQAPVHTAVRVKRVREAVRLTGLFFERDTLDSVHQPFLKGSQPGGLLSCTRVEHVFTRDTAQQTGCTENVSTCAQAQLTLLVSPQ